MSDVATSTDEAQVLLRREGRAGRMTLNRPDAMNALTYPMIGEIDKALRAWRDDAAVELVIIDGAGSRGLCAGGDVRELYDRRSDGVAFSQAFWRDEYHLNALIAHYPKPYVAIMDGIVMGGGIGVSAHGSHRIVTEKSKLAMPETGIGLIPDVGGTWLLGRAQGELGIYLGLTGAHMTGADAIQTGFADSFVSSERLPALVAALARAGGGMVEETIAEFEATVPDSPLAAARRDIDRWFDCDSVEEILAALNTTTNDMAQNARKAILRKSPKATKLAFAAMKKARGFSKIEEALALEYRLVTRLFEDREFIEGVRALIIDKDRRPQWSPATLAEVTPQMVAEYLDPLPDGLDLVFDS